MIQLTFQPAFDPYHSMYRCIRLLTVLFDEEPLHRDLYRILDFYLLFPFRMESIRLQKEDIWIRGLAKEFSSFKPYGPMPEDFTLFQRMRPIQTVALETLARESFISNGALQENEIRREMIVIPPGILSRVEEENSKEKDVIICLRHLAANYPLTGDSGLKARTGLLEYRYDAI